MDCALWAFMEEPPPGTATVTEARFVTSCVPFEAIVSLPLTSSDALTVTAVPVFVLPVI